MAMAATAAGGNYSVLAREVSRQRLLLAACHHRRVVHAYSSSSIRRAAGGTAMMTRRRGRLRVSCSSNDSSLPSDSPYEILGVEPSCSLAELKAAFRDKVKRFHPDVCQDLPNSDATIRRVIKAYDELLSSRFHNPDAINRCNGDSDPFEEPECEAYDVFINETLCIGKGCPYSCVKTAPHAFSFAPEIGTARAFSQGHDDDYQVQMAVGQCPRQCIHYVTPTQRAVLEELLYRILDAPYDPAETAFLDSLIRKASYENNRYRSPKPKPKSKVSNEFVDWY